MTKYYKIANKIIKFEIPYEIEDGGNIDLFKLDQSNENYDIIYKILNEKSNIPKFNKLLYKESSLEVYGNDEIIQWYNSYPHTLGEYSCLIERKNSNKRELYIYPSKEKCYPHMTQVFKNINIQGALLKEKILILHSSFIINNNDDGILFTAMSGVGKSTQASLWEKYQGAEIVNGDRAAIGEKNGKVYAYGLPFCGSSKICKNKEVPIKAIVVLEQSKYNFVRNLSYKEAFKVLLGQVAINRWNKNEMILAMNYIENLIQSVPIVKLSCLPNEDATKVLKEFLYK